VYRATKEPRTNPISGRFFHVLEASSWDEEVMKDWIRRAGLAISAEQTEVNTAVGVGHIDGLICGDLAKPPVLLEVKAINHFTWQRYDSGNELPIDYMTQSALYLASEDLRKLEVKRAVLLIVNKNTRALLEYVLEYDPEIDTLFLVSRTNSNGDTHIVDPGDPDAVVLLNVISESIDRLDQVKSHAGAGTMPPRPFVKGDWHCDYCSWKGKCWSDYDVERDIVVGVDTRIDEPKMASTLEEYEALGRAVRRCEMERDDLRPQIVKAIVAAGVETIHCGKYKATLKKTKKSEMLKVEKE